MNVLITGAGGIVGSTLCERCEDAGLNVRPCGRSARTAAWTVWDMSREAMPVQEPVDIMLHAAPLWLLPEHMEKAASLGLQRIVCYSSTSVLTKQSSPNARERSVAAALLAAEKNILDASSRFRVPTTVFRPTMIYGFGRDHNISRIASFISRYRFFPIAGAGTGRRQPIHAGDAAGAAMAALDRPGAAGKTYVITGGEALAYRDMVGRLFDALEKPRRILSLPIWFYRSMLNVGAALGRDVSGGMANRMNQDLVFDSSEARADLGFAPEDFLKHPERDVIPA